MKKLSLVFLSISLCLFGRSQLKSSNYISLKFTYRIFDKPVPNIIFSLDSVDSHKGDPYYYVGYIFRVSSQEFLSIENLVKQGSSYLIIDSFATRFYDFEIVSNGVRAIYGTDYFQKTKKLFSQILQLFKTSKEYSEIVYAFDEIYGRVMPIGIDVSN